ncbi:MAG: hypothetical protein IM631_12535 [Cytophagales bacterium]|nr:hypothetical protein [Cytophagales bacterium]MCA6382342.1 hypothetical protein [Cytophagales bacterium]
MLFDYLKEKGEVLKHQEIRDFGLSGFERDEKIVEYANDYLSELQSNRAEWSQFKKNPHSIDPINY